jgi:hypothetical protein
MPNDLSISEAKNQVLKMQINLAVAIRRKNIDITNKFINTLVRSKVCQYLAVYKTISGKGSRTK